MPTASRKPSCKAVNLGDDADTTGAICGQLAGAYWGESNIPGSLRSGLARMDMLEEALGGHPRRDQESRVSGGRNPMALRRMTWALALSLLLASTASAQHQIVCSGEAAGGYAAFPDVCRLRNGDLYCVFYSGYGHVSTPNDKWPKGGRIMAVRSSDNGKTWSKPVVAIDTDLDDRDPSVACLKDGTLLLNWFTLQKNQVAILLARSTDNGKTWSEPVKLNLDSPYSFACSVARAATARRLADPGPVLRRRQDEEDLRCHGQVLRRRQDLERPGLHRREGRHLPRRRNRRGAAEGRQAAGSTPLVQGGHALRHLGRFRQDLGAGASPSASRGTARTSCGTAAA